MTPETATIERPATADADVVGAVGAAGTIGTVGTANTSLTDTITLADTERQPCEIWTRVMGYHRPVTSFNKGKQSEYAERMCFVESTGGER